MDIGIIIIIAVVATMLGGFVFVKMQQNKTKSTPPPFDLNDEGNTDLLITQISESPDKTKKRSER